MSAVLELVKPGATGPRIGTMDGATPRVVLVAGGDSASGLAVASKFHARGAQVIVCGRSVAALEAARQALPGVMTFVCDITVQAQVGRMLVAIEEEFDAIDVLVSTPGHPVARDFADQASLDDISYEIEINLTAHIKLIDLAMPLLRRRSASIVFVTPDNGGAPVGRAPVYYAAKAGLRSFARSLRQQMTPLGIRVVEIVPPVVEIDAGSAVMRVAANWVAGATLRALDHGHDHLQSAIAIRSTDHWCAGCLPCRTAC